MPGAISSIVVISAIFLYFIFRL